MPALETAVAAPPANVRSRRGVEAIHTLAGLDRVAGAWERLTAGAHPASEFPYARAWAAALPRSQSLHVLIATGGESPAIAPLVVNRGSAGRLTLLAAEMYEIQEFPCGDEIALAELARAIVRTGRPLYLKRMPADSPALAAIEVAFRGHGYVRQRPVGGSPWIPLDESWAEPEMRLEAGRRSDLRRARRRAEKLGAFETAILAPTRAELPPLLDEFFQIEAAGWKGAHGTALAADPVRGPFFQRYAERACAQGILRIAALRIGGAPAAAQIAIENGGRFDLLRAGYDERFARCSPGMLLTAESIRYAARRGLRSYEFNGDVEPWTRIWTRREHPCRSLRAYPFNARGACALLADGLDAALGSAKGRVFAPPRKGVRETAAARPCPVLRDVLKTLRRRFHP